MQGNTRVERITKGALASFLKSPQSPKDRELTERVLGGFYVRRYRNSDRAAFYIRAKLNRTGKKISVLIGEANAGFLDAAREIAEEHKGRILAGIDVRVTLRELQEQQDKERVTLADGFALYLKDNPQLKRSTVDGYKSKFRNNIETTVLAGRFMVGIKPDELNRLLERIEKAATQAGVRRILTMTFNHVWAIYDIQGRNPADRIKKGLGKPPKARQVWLSEGRIGAFWDAHTQALKHWLNALESAAQGDSRHAYWQAHSKVSQGLLWRLLTLAGSRLDETRRLEWSNVKLDGGKPLFTLKDTKNGGDHTLPITPAIQTVFRLAEKHLKQQGNPHVFVGYKGQGHVYDCDGYRKWRHLALWDDITHHPLRDTLKTHIMNLGVTWERSEQILNHKLPGVGAVYSHPVITQWEKDLAAYSDWLDRKAKEYVLSQAGDAEEVVAYLKGKPSPKAERAKAGAQEDLLLPDFAEIDEPKKKTNIVMMRGSAS